MISVAQFINVVIIIFKNSFFTKVLFEKWILQNYLGFNSS